MKVFFYSLSLLFLISNFTWAQNDEVFSKNITAYIHLMESLIDHNYEFKGIEHNLVIIEKEWYSSTKTKGQFYGKLLHMYLYDQGIIKECNEDMIKVFQIGNRYNFFYNRLGEEKNKLYIIYFQRQQNAIHIMFRNDVGVYSFTAKLVKDSGGKTQIVDIPASFLPHD